MIGRYVVEIILVVLCGMGLHSTEVTRIGGSEVVIQFGEVGYWLHRHDVHSCFV